MTSRSKQRRVIEGKGVSAGRDRESGNGCVEPARDRESSAAQGYRITIGNIAESTVPGDVDGPSVTR